MTPDPGPQTPDPVTPLKVSILIATRNRPDALRRCVESVARQNYPDMEVIILDDASNPPVDQVAIKRLVRGQHPIRILRSEQHLGLISIRNQLIEEASGDVLFVIDDDAYFEESGSIQSIVDAFRASPDCAVIAVKIIDYRGGKQRPLTPHGRQFLRNDPSLIDRPHRVSYFLGGGACPAAFDHRSVRVFRRDAGIRARRVGLCLSRAGTGVFYSQCAYGSASP